MIKNTNFKNNGFTIIELIVVIAIMAVLSGIILFSISHYISLGKDASLAGNLAVLVPSGEAYYNSSGDSYAGFCQTDVVLRAYEDAPKNPLGICYNGINNQAGICCNVNDLGDRWAACGIKFSDSSIAICVDSRGIKKEIDAGNCASAVRCD